MAKTPLSSVDALYAELYGLKVILQCLLAILFDVNRDPQVVRRLHESVSASIDNFRFHMGPSERAEAIREAMHERATSIISAASNPKRKPRS
jgi:hypothetical protein